MVWYPNTRASNYVTSNPCKLSNSKPYVGRDKNFVSNGNFLLITQTAETNLNTSSESHALKNALVVPSIKRNLLSVPKFCSNNNSFFEFDSIGFYAKDKKTGKRVYPMQ